MSNVYSASQFRTAGCRWRWWLRYIKGYRPIFPDRPLGIGSRVHKAIEAYLLGNSWQDALGKLKEKDEIRLDRLGIYDEYEQQIEEIESTAETIADRFIHHHFPWNEWETWEDQNRNPMVEVPISLPTESGDVFVAIIDWVAYHKPTKRTFINDWKVVGTLQNAETESAQVAHETDIQQPLYQYALKKGLGIETSGTGIIQIRSTLPKVPKQNKDGSTSKQDILTDWDTYAATVRARGDNPNDYLEMRDKLRAKRWWEMFQTFRGERFIQSVWDRVAEKHIAELNEIRANPDEEPVRDFGAFACRGCWAKEICVMNLNGVPLHEVEGFEQKKEEDDERHDTHRGEVEFEIDLADLA